MSLCLYAMVAFDRDSGIAAESAIKYFVLGSMASGTLLYGMSIVYGVTGSLELAGDRGRRAQRRIGRQHRPGVRHCISYRRRGIQIRRRAVPHVDTGCVRGLADLRDGVHRHRLETGRVRARHASVAGGAGGFAGGLEPDAGGACGAVDGHRQHRRHRADQSEAHAGVFDDFARRLCAARNPVGHGAGLSGLDVLHDQLRDRRRRRLRHDLAAGAARASRRTRSSISADSMPAVPGSPA